MSQHTAPRTARDLQHNAVVPHLNADKRYSVTYRLSRTNSSVSRFFFRGIEDIGEVTFPGYLKYGIKRPWFFPLAAIALILSIHTTLSTLFPALRASVLSIALDVGSWVINTLFPSEGSVNTKEPSSVDPTAMIPGWFNDWGLLLCAGLGLLSVIGFLVLARVTGVGTRMYAKIYQWALLEEVVFRYGSEKWTWAQRIKTSVFFGSLHFLNIIVPISVAVGLIAVGGVFMVAYLLTYKSTQSRDKAVFVSTQFHAVYNVYAFALLGFSLSTALFLVSALMGFVSPVLMPGMGVIFS